MEFIIFETLGHAMRLLRSFRRFDFTVGQYNILAGYVGNNMEPWFLYGIDMPEERRREIFRLHKEKLPNGDYANPGWPNYAPRQRKRK